ncbi:hypothetical protein CTAYLR_000318 [Chrysophaeum taylorii]|uniref:Uncharacterized protein n=1 Tax=Chrysophaeum taylorii TaxID=2483200 RepID=A0AAD7UEI5_9STRA|nr:hypothetical protein CTAYLR_000318 [Chrysophaeum taylorii]
MEEEEEEEEECRRPSSKLSSSPAATRQDVGGYQGEASDLGLPEGFGYMQWPGKAPETTIVYKVWASGPRAFLTAMASSCSRTRRTITANGNAEITTAAALSRGLTVPPSRVSSRSAVSSASLARVQDFDPYAANADDYDEESVLAPGSAENAAADDHAAAAAACPSCTGSYCHLIGEEEEEEEEDPLQGRQIPRPPDLVAPLRSGVLEDVKEGDEEAGTPRTPGLPRGPPAARSKVY